MPGLKKGKWASSEDELLVALVKMACGGDNVVWTAEATDAKKISWPQLASRISGRTSKQCRERWYEHLSPAINRGPFSAEEDALMMQQFRQLGNCWTQIAKKLEGRTADATKLRIRVILQAEKEGRSSPPSRSQVPAKTFFLPSHNLEGVVEEILSEQFDLGNLDDVLDRESALPSVVGADVDLDSLISSELDQHAANFSFTGSSNSSSSSSSSSRSKVASVDQTPSPPSLDSPLLVPLLVPLLLP